MSVARPTVPIATRLDRLRASRLAWPLAAVLHGGLMTACALWGLKVGERGIDSRAQDLLACYAIGSPLAVLALAPIYRWLIPRRPRLLRAGVALVLVAAASAAMIALVAFLAANPWMDAFRPDLPLAIRVRSLVEPYLLEVFLFLTIGYRIAAPQGLLPLVLVAWWLADRRGLG